MSDGIAARIAEIIDDVVDQTKRLRGVDEYVVAQRILAAIREPTDTMVDAGADTADGPCDCMYSRHVWHAMVDHAIGEGLDDARRGGKAADNAPNT